MCPHIKHPSTEHRYLESITYYVKNVKNVTSDVSYVVILNPSKHFHSEYKHFYQYTNCVQSEKTEGKKIFNTSMANREGGQNKQQELINNYSLKFHLRALYMCGLLPPESISSSPWKSRLYDVYTCLTLIWFVPTVTAMCIELLNYLDSLEKAIPVIYQVSAFVLSAILAMYFVYKRKVMMKLFYTLETIFKPYMERLSSSTKQLRTMEGSLYVGKMITNVFMVVGWLTVVTWAIIPCANGYIEFVLQINQDDIEENRGKYFGIAMWLPLKVNRSPMYEITQVLHGFSIFTCAMCISGSYISMLALMYHTASHFSMLVDLIEELDVILPESNQSGPQCVRQRREGEDVGQKLRCQDAGKEGSQCLIVDRDTLLYQHLVLCTRYHQQLIE